MTAIALIATVVPLGVSITTAVFLAWPKIIEQRSLAKDRACARAYADRLWTLGDHDSAVKLAAWLRNPEHPPPELDVCAGLAESRIAQRGEQRRQRPSGNRRALQN